MSRCYVVVVGAIGSGKSSVCRRLAAGRADVIDADEVGHMVVAGPAFEAIASTWPEVITDGVVDRRALGRIVFSSAEALRELESITHPLIQEELESLIDDSTSETVVVELSVLRDLLPGNWFRVAVDAADGVRFCRLIHRGMEREDALRRMRSQPPRAAWLAAADFVIDNNGSEHELDAQIDRLMQVVEDRCCE